jgi:hypothetical protein
MRKQADATEDTTPRISSNTARSTLKSIFGKTWTIRQSELVCLLLNISTSQSPHGSASILPVLAEILADPSQPSMGYDFEETERIINNESPQRRRDGFFPK